MLNVHITFGIPFITFFFRSRKISRGLRFFVTFHHSKIVRTKIDDLLAN